jgi:AcrR family transcriptional regulator
MEPAPVRTRRSARQQALLDGLIEIFLAEGFSHFSVEDLAARLQCSKSTLYALAPSKEQLITAVVRAFFRRAAERVELHLATEAEPTHRIGAYLHAIAAELAPASSTFYRDLSVFAPAREIYWQNTAIAARRVQELVSAAERPDRPVRANFIGAVAAQMMESIQQGRMKALTSLDDATAYSALADLIVAGVAGASRNPRGGAQRSAAS